MRLALRRGILTIAIVLAASSAHAVDYYWDSNGTTAGFGSTSGTWGASTFFSTSSAGTAITSNTTTTTSDTLNFGFGSNGYTGNPTVTVSGIQDIGSLTVAASSTGGLTITGGVINLGGSATITQDSAGVVDIRTAITGTSGLVKAGSGLVFLGGTSTFTGNISINGGRLQLQGVPQPLLGVGGTFAGNMAIASGATFVYNGGNAQTLSGTISGAGSVWLAGSQRLSLTQANTFTGDTVIIGGYPNARLGVDNNLALQNSAIDTGTATSARLIMGAGVTSPTLGGLKGSVALGTVVITGYDSVTALTLNPGSGFSPSYAGNIANGATDMTLTKIGLGTQILSGTNTYTGATTISAGTLHFAAPSALYNSTSGSWTATNIRVQDGGVIGLSVGGTNEFSAGNITTLLTNLAASTSSTNGMNAGSGFAFDTTNALGGSFTIADVIADSTGASGGARSVTKLGTGRLVLSAANTYTGNTIVSSGTLAVNGSLSTGTVSVAAAAWLQGSGTIAGPVSVAGNLSPGNSVPGTLSVGSLQLSGSSTTLMEISGSTAGLYDQVVAAGAVSYGGSLLLNISGSYANGTTFNLFDFASEVGSFSSLSLFGSGPYASLQFGAVGEGGYGADAWVTDWTTPGVPNGQRLVFYQSTGDLVVVPEPSTYVLLALGAGVAGLMHRPKRRTTRSTSV